MFTAEELPALFGCVAVTTRERVDQPVRSDERACGSDVLDHQITALGFARGGRSGLLSLKGAERRRAPLVVSTLTTRPISLPRAKPFDAYAAPGMADACGQ